MVEFNEEQLESKGSLADCGRCEPQKGTAFCRVHQIIRFRLSVASFKLIITAMRLKARFHYDRGKKHSLFVLLIFFVLASMSTARFNQR